MYEPVPLADWRLAACGWWLVTRIAALRSQLSALLSLLPYSAIPADYFTSFCAAHVT